MSRSARKGIRRGILVAIFLLIFVYVYLFISTISSVPNDLRADLQNAQENHLNHRHEEALDLLTPFDRFKKFPNTDFYGRARTLKNNLETLLEKQERIHAAYTDAMKLQVDPEGNLSPTRTKENLTQLERKLNDLWKNNREHFEKHPEMPSPYPEIQTGMKDLIIHRMVRLSSGSQPQFLRLYEYKSRVYSRFLDESRNVIDRAPDPSYRTALDFISAVHDLLKETLYEPQAEKLRRTLRTKITDHVDRLNQNCRKQLQKNNYDQAIQILRKNRQHFKNVEPWETILKNRIDTLEKMKQLMQS